MSIKGIWDGREQGDHSLRKILIFLACFTAGFASAFFLIKSTIEFDSFYSTYIPVNPPVSTSNIDSIRSFVFSKNSINNTPDDSFVLKIKSEGNNCVRHFFPIHHVTIGSLFWGAVSAKSSTHTIWVDSLICPHAVSGD